MSLWPHQSRALSQSRECYGKGIQAWCLAAPCGAGKSRIMQEIAIPAADKGKHVCLYTHRVMLTRQTINSFLKTGVQFGVVASGFEEYRNSSAKIQICSLDTVFSRLGNWRHEFPRADIVIVDEAHQQTAEKAKAVFGRHKEEGAKQIGFTATPVDLGEMYQQLVSAGTYSEMLECKAHLPIHCYGPDRPDTTSLKTMKSGDFSQETDRKVNRVPTIVGRVYEYWQKLNPQALPAVGFAPGVEESKWFVEEFMKRGVPCAHIDAERVVMVEKGLDGVLRSKEYRTDESSREAIVEGSRAGHFKVLWNRFILREAIDMPWLYHAIAATSMGSVATYLQSIGRVQRYWPEYDHVILQDHSGNLDRHDPPDIDRDWTLGCTANSIHKAEVEKKRRKQGDDAEPICCPNCAGYRLSGPQCPYCGYMHKRSVRMVRQIDGTLVRKTGRNIKHKAAKGFDDYLRSAIYAGWANGLTVKQAYYIAKKKAAVNGIRPGNSSMRVPDSASSDWHKSCREIYPHMKPKHLGAT
jgi:superfamily II DNA or RNA helicase